MQLSRVFHFEASHIIPGKGICSQLHGHSFELELCLIGDPQTNTGSTFDDPNYLKHLVTPMLQRLNGRHLNYVIKVPTIENICLYIAHEINSLCDGRLSTCCVSVPSMFSAMWNVIDADSELFDADKYPSTGYHDTFHEIPAFASMEARAKWVAHQNYQLQVLYAKMTEVGSRIAAFERYKASLDADEAEKLFEALKHIDEEEL